MEMLELELKSTVNEMKSSVQGLNSNFELTEEENQ